MEQVSGTDLDALIAAKLVCCSGLVQLAAAVDQVVTAALSGVGGLLTGRGYLWVGAALGTLVAALYRRRGRADARDGANAAGYPTRQVP